MFDHSKMTLKNHIDSRDTDRITEMSKSLFEFSKEKKSSKSPKNKDITKIHSLYQDLYLTDLKNDVEEGKNHLNYQKEINQEKSVTMDKQKKELAQAKRTITNYRKMISELQQELYRSAKGLPR